MREFRGRVLGALVIIAVPLALFLAWTETGLRPDVERRAALQLARTLTLMADRIGDSALTDSLAEQLGAATGLRVTFIGPEGGVLGDSDVAMGRLGDLDDHGDRREVLEARAEGLGYARRGSRSVALPLFYVAIPHAENVIRIAIPENDVSWMLGRTRRTAVFAGGIAFLLLLLLIRPRRGPAGRGADQPQAGIEPVDEQEATDAAHAARLQAMLDAIDDGVAVVDSDARIVMANRAFEGWTGRRDLGGRPVATLFRHPGPRDAVNAALQDQAVQVESVLATRTVRVRSAPLEKGALLTLRDLTATRRLEGVRRDFVANVSHELKTPMAAIRGFTEPLLEGGVDAPQSGEFLRRILANLDRMQLLVDDLLDLARLESGGWAPHVEPVELGAVIRQVWNRLEPLAGSRSVGLELDIANASDRLLADAEALEQIMTNLLDNAIRYSPEGGIVRVSARGVHDRNAVRMEVADAGPGIPSEHVDRVFERFYRADSGRSRAAGGTGLGLSIVKHLVVAHGGTVGIESELGRGTTVWLELPGTTGA